MSKEALRHFSGFVEGKVAMVTLPESVFTELLPLVDDLLELKVILLVLRRLAQLRADAAPWITLAELHADPAVQASLGEEPHMLAQALELAVTRGALLRANWKRADGSAEERYFANSPRGRASVNALHRGVEPARASQTAHTNIFTLYEQNIGPLTALLSEDLIEAESIFSAEWIEEAFREAVSRNKRNWKYIYAILERWRSEGKDEVDRRDREAPDWKDIEGDYSEYIQH